jgi:hypothetical protein
MSNSWSVRPSRRELLRAAAFLGAAGFAPSRLLAQGDDGWWAGDLAHLIPAASDRRLAIKCSFRSAREVAPQLAVGSRRVEGRRSDSQGLFWSFDCDGLEPDTEYELRLVEGAGARSEALCDAWPLRTYPAAHVEPERARILVYTCAGGHPDLRLGSSDTTFLPLAVRRRLLRRALSFRPQAAIAIGDHIYWDQRTWMESESVARREAAVAFYDKVGQLDRSAGALGTANEAILKRAVDPQIAELYGTLLRSTPSYFVNDDHDYFENDEANPRFVTLPPARYQLDFARFVRSLYLPEFLPDAERPVAMSGTGAGDRASGISESFGTFRYGRLAEALIYDCGRYLSLKGPVAGLVPGEVERWLQARTADSRVRQLFHVPSHPFGWSAGKWREWYPDVAAVPSGAAGADSATVARMGVDNGSRFRLTTEADKYLWQSGWFEQHQRLLRGLSEQTTRPGIVLSGDLHAIGHSRLMRSADLDLSRNPVHAILTGPVGTNRGWASLARGTAPVPATGVTHEPEAGAIEKNGFTLLDVTPDDVQVRLFAWRDEPLERIDSLEPYHTAEIRRT